MIEKFSRQDFLIKDLAVSIGAGGRGGTWLPGPDDETPPSPISPVASVLANIGLIEAVRGAMIDAIEAKNFDDIAQAFVAGDAGGNPAIRNAIHEVGAAVVASAAFAAGGGKVGLVDPNCGGTSFETIPPTLTPVVHAGIQVHKVTELPRLRKQLSQALEYMDKAAEMQMPVGEEVGEVRRSLESALKSLG